MISRMIRAASGVFGAAKIGKFAFQTELQEGLSPRAWAEEGASEQVNLCKSRFAEKTWHWYGGVEFPHRGNFGLAFLGLPGIGRCSSWLPQKIPQGLKPRLIPEAISARLESCPVT